MLSKIRELRMGLGLSISQLSQGARVNASAMSWIELGKLAASPTVRAALAGFYEKPEKTLFHSSGLAK